jgi:hypothetical protein
MQANLERGKAASGVRSAGRFVAISASGPLIVTLALLAPDRAHAAECGATHPAGIHAAASSSGVHAATAGPLTSGGGGGGGGSLGCPNGSSASALHGPPLHGLPMAASGKVVDPGGHSAAHTATQTRTATTRTANDSAHLRGGKPPPDAKPPHT